MESEEPQRPDCALKSNRLFANSAASSHPVTASGLARSRNQSRAPSKSSKKRPAPSNAPLIGSQTTQAERKRRRCGLSMAVQDDETEIVDYSNMFHPNSTINYSWGLTLDKPIEAVKRKRRGPTVKKMVDSRFGIFIGIRPQSEKKPKPVEPNSPERSHLLRMPLEIREVVYGLLLTHQQPILVNYAWHMVERRSPQDHNIIRVCKQISDESTCYLYKHNIFHALVRESTRQDCFIADSKFLPYFRNVVIECDRDHWNLDWFDKACISLEKLVKATTSLDSLTMIVSPQKIGLTHTAAGLETNPITFADFFSTKAKFMRLIRNLRCKVFNVVMKKPGRKRLLMSVDIRFLPMSVVEQNTAIQALESDGTARWSGLKNEETAKRSRCRVGLVRQELLGLKARFEEVFENQEKAIEQGRCTLMGENESA